MPIRTAFSMIAKVFRFWGGHIWRIGGKSRGPGQNHGVWQQVKGCQGFALMELMLAMVIAGLLMTTGVKMWRVHRLQSAQATTLSHQNAVFQALADHWTLHGCLPWPGALSGPLQGMSQQPAAASFHRGIIPYRTLGLPQHVAMDGWGHWMVYVVDDVMTVPHRVYQENWCRACFAKPSPLDVMDQGRSVQEGLLHSPQHYQEIASRSGGAIPNARVRMDGIAVILLGDPDGALFATTTLKEVSDLGPVIVSRSEADLAAPRRVVQWRTRSQLFSMISIKCVDTFFALSPPTLDRMPTASQAKVIMKPLS